VAEEGETYNGQEVVQGANVFRIVQNGSNVGIILDCQTEEAAKVAYAQILASCKENGGVISASSASRRPGAR